MAGVAEWSLSCVDAGSEYCPCQLAVSGECYVCSQLRGESFCTCSWSGTCIYLNYSWARGQVRKRFEQEVPVAREELAPNLIRLKLELPQGWSRNLQAPGTFLFLRTPEMPATAAVPVSVVYAAAGSAQVVISVDGPKTKLLAAGGSRLVVRGPYYNGIQGLAALKRTREGFAVIVAGGVGQATAVLVARQLVRGGNRVKACLAPGRAGVNFVAAALQKEGVEVTEVRSLREEGLSLLTEWLNQAPAVVFSGGPNSLHREVANLIARHGGETPLATSQNAVMCCGEGLCGSCLTFTTGGRRVPRCKGQFLVEERG